MQTEVHSILSGFSVIESWLLMLFKYISNVYRIVDVFHKNEVSSGSGKKKKKTHKDLIKQILFVQNQYHVYYVQHTSRQNILYSQVIRDFFIPTLAKRKHFIFALQ